MKKGRTICRIFIEERSLYVYIYKSIQIYRRKRNSKSIFIDWTFHSNEFVIVAFSVHSLIEMTIFNNCHILM